MNLGEIIADVRSLIIEPVPAFRTDEDLITWANQAVQELGMLYRIEDHIEIAVTPGVNSYPLPDNFLTVKGALDEDGNFIPVVPVETVKKDATEKYVMYLLNDSISLFPEPSSPFTMTVYFDRRPALLQKRSDVPEIPLPYHKHIVDYVVARALLKDEDFEGASIYLNQYQEGKRMIMGQKTLVSQDINTILELVRAGVLNASEAAEWMNIPVKSRVQQRVDLEEKGFALLRYGVIDKSDFIKNAEFPNTEEIKERLEQTWEDFITIPPWGGKRK